MNLFNRGNNNNAFSGNSFGNRNNNSSFQGNLFGSNNNNNNNNRGNNSWGNSNLFGNGNNSNNRNNMFGNNSNGSSSGGLGLLGSSSNNNNNFMGMNSSSTIGTYNHGYDVSKLPKTEKEGYPIMAINAQQPFRGKSLDELRVEDYFSYKGNKIPSQNLNIIHNQWQQNIQNRGGQSGNLFGGNNNNNNGGNLFGGNNNNNNNGGLFGNKNNSGGLFGNNNNNNGGNLFGGNNNNNRGGLFGNNNNNNNNGGGLFGGNNNNNGGLFGNKNNSGGLFGNNNNNNGGGLFGNNNNNNNRGGLFGNNNNNGGGLFGSSSSGGLFGQNKSGGLFGNNNNNGGGLFGGNNNSGGLFGNKGGLFGNNNNNNGGGLFGSNGGGLFGGQRTGGLFSGLNNNNNNNGGGLFGTNNNNNNNNNNGYYNNDAQLLLEAQRLLGGIDLEQAKSFDSIRLNFGTTQQNYNLFGKSVGAETTKEFLGRYEAEDNFSQSTKRTYKSSSYKSSSRKSSFYGSGDSDDDSQLIFRSKAHHHHHSRLRDSNPHLLARKANSEDFIDRNSSFYDDYSEVGKRIRLNSYTEAKNVESSLDISSMYDSIRIYVFLNQQGQEKNCSLNVCYSKTCLEVKRIALEKLFDETEAQLSKYKLVYNNRILRDTTKIKDTLIKDNDKIYIIPDSESDNYSYSSFSSPSKEHLASESLIPRLTKEYHTEPSMPRISRMTADELRNVENFVIWNEYVKVIFDGVTDITGLNLDEIVHLKHRSVEIYPESGAVSIPQTGYGLNKAATIEFYQWSVPKKYQNDLRSYDAKLRDWARSIGAQFVSFNSAQGVVCIRVENFNTKNQEE